MTTSVIFNPWSRRRGTRRNLPKSPRGEVAWWHHPLLCPLFVYADFEAMQNAEGVFVANLLCYSSAEEEAIHVLEGEDCALQFLHDLDDLVDVPENNQER